MIVVRALAGVIAGYLVYALTAMLLVGPVMASQGPVMTIVALVALALIGGVAGYVAAAVGGEKGRLAVYIAAALVALAAIANLAMGLGAEPTWF